MVVMSMTNWVNSTGFVVVGFFYGDIFSFFIFIFIEGMGVYQKHERQYFS